MTRKPVETFKRNKNLENNYSLLIQLGMISSLIIFIILFNINWTSAPPVGIDVVQQEEVIMEEVIQTKQEIQAPPPPRPSVPIEVPNDEVIEDELIELDAELDFDQALELPAAPPSIEEEEDLEDEIFIVVENPPVLIGGIGSVQKKITYPEMARVAGIEGKVIVQFVVDENGNVANPRVVRGIGGGCDEEALKAVKTAKFQPGKQRGKPVKVSYTLPINFSLRSN